MGEIQRVHRKLNCTSTVQVSYLLVIKSHSARFDGWSRMCCAVVIKQKRKAKRRHKCSYS